MSKFQPPKVVGCGSEIPHSSGQNLKQDNLAGTGKLAGKLGINILS